MLEIGDEEWVDQGCLLLSDKDRSIQLYSYTQPTKVPYDVIDQLQQLTGENYPLSWSGYSTTVGSLMSQKLGVEPSEWHLAACGIHRGELIKNAAKSLAHAYKLAVKSKIDQV